MTDYNTNTVNRTDCKPWRDAETVRYYYNKRGYSLKETGETLGCAECTVYQWCRKHGIETRDPQEARDTGTPEELKDKEWLRREYNEKERVMADIGDQLDVTALTVSKWARKHDLPTRGRHRRRKRETVNCNNCGEAFEVIQSRAEGNNYCQPECYYEDLDMPTGEDHWSWKDTPDHYRSGEAWEKLRKQARERDDYECQMCGVSQDELSRALDAHHLKRRREFDDPDEADKLDNLVSLCRSCHRKAEPYAPLLPEL